MLEESDEKPRTNLDIINPEANKELDKVDSISTESNDDSPLEIQEQVNYGQLGARPKTGSLIKTPGNPLAASDRHSSVLEKFDEFPASTPIIETDALFEEDDSSVVGDLGSYTPF